MSVRVNPAFTLILPPLSQAEDEALGASIRTDGVREPIWVDEDGNILDGHHRFKHAPNAPLRVKSGLTEAGKKAFVLACNFHRRNLSPEQKAALREAQKEIAAELRAEGQAQEQIAGALGVDRATISRWLTPNVQAHEGRTPDIDSRVKLTQAAKDVVRDRVEGGEAQAQIAADFGISQQHVSRTHKIEKKRRDREAEIAEQRAAIERGEVVAGEGPYDVIVIDPPWPYEGDYSPDHWMGRVQSPYPSMTLEDLAALQIPAADESMLWLWTTHRFMPDAFDLLRAWGFEHKAVLTWVKDRMGIGHWLRSKSEFCILAVRGSPQVNLTNQTTVLEAPAREHSRKPDEFYQMVEGLCLGPRRVDWFSREQRSGWDQLGNDPAKFGSAA